MKRFNEPLPVWTAEPINKGDFQIKDEKGRNVCDLYSETLFQYDKGKFPTDKEAEFNCLLITKAPAMALRLSEIRSQLIDRKFFKKNSVFIIGIDSILEGLENGK